MSRIRMANAKIENSAQVSSRCLKLVHGLAGGRLPVSQLESLLRSYCHSILEPVRLELDEEGSLTC
jgi:hypothetical protein